MKAIITGISGQDGYFLSQLLLSKGYKVHGILRRNSSMTQGTLGLLPENIKKQIIIHYGDTTDSKKFSIIIPAYNEEKRIKPVLEDIVDYITQNNLDWV